VADIVNFKDLKSGSPSLLCGALKRVFSYQHMSGNIPFERRHRRQAL